MHVAYEDAEAYARWAGKELPTEAEWEFAARGGLEGAEFCWGDELMPGGKPHANTWQGEFPWQNLLEDGFEWTAPVGSFPPNGYGLYDMAGNVWEWTTDWYQEHAKIDSPCCTITNPRGGERDRSFDPRTPDVKIPRKVMKGGSYLCAPNYCQRYRPAARMAQGIDTSTCHLGFRCIVRAAELATKKSARPRVLTFDDVREIALSMPDVIETTAYGMPAFKAGKRRFAVQPIARPDVEPNSLGVHISFEERDRLMAARPDVYYLTDHFRPSPRRSRAPLERQPHRPSRAARRGMASCDGGRWPQREAAHGVQSAARRPSLDVRASCSSAERTRPRPGREN